MDTKRLREAVLDPNTNRELHQCTSVSEIVACLNRHGVACTREEGTRLIRAYERVAADSEPMDTEKPYRTADGKGGLFGFVRSVFHRGTRERGKRMPDPGTQTTNFDAIIRQMNK